MILQIKGGVSSGGSWWVFGKKTRNGLCSSHPDAIE